MMRRLFIVLILLLGVWTLNAQENECKVNVNGYTQVRMETDYKSNPNFYLRRARLWFDGQLPVEGKGKFVYRVKFYFTKGYAYPKLMDAKVGYKYKNLTIWVGQQVPDWGRQIMKGDTKILLGERARYNYYLSPGEDGLLRDIGVQIFYKLGNRGHVSLGYFNGYFANNYQSTNRNLLVTQRFTYTIFRRGADFVDVGYSLMYRKAKQLKMPKLFVEPFTGSDFRYEVELEARLARTDVEAGVTQALLKDIDRQQVYHANGYYINVNQFITCKDVAIVGVDYLQLPSDRNLQVQPWVICGYTHLFKDHKVKLSVNQWIKYENSAFTTFTRVQFQVFLK